LKSYETLQAAKASDLSRLAVGFLSSPDYSWGDWNLAQQFDFTGHFQNTGHTGVFPGILKKSCGIKGQAKNNLSS